MKRFFYLFLAIFTFACSPIEEQGDNNPVEPPTFTLQSDKYIEVKSNNQVVDIDFTTNRDWSAIIETEESNDWCRLSMSEGKAGKYELSLKIDKNLAEYAREAKLTFFYDNCSETIEIKQHEQLFVDVDNDTYVVESLGGELSVNLKSNTDFSVSVDKKYDWISYIATKATKESTLFFQINANSSVDERIGYVNVNYSDGTKKITIKQKGVDPILEITNNYLDFESEASEASFEYTANFKCNVSSSSDWLKVSHGYNGYTVNVSVSSNTSEDDRTGVITLSGYGLTQKIDVTQKGTRVSVNITLTSPGTLPTYLGSSKIYDITHLTVSGPINGTDMRLIKKLAGCTVFPANHEYCDGKGYESFYSSETGKLKYLDLSNAQIVSGGKCFAIEKYYYNGSEYDTDSHYKTVDNTINEYMFTDCYELKTLILPNSVTTIKEYAFMDTSLETIELPADISTIEGSFDSYYLKEIKLSSNNNHFCVKDGILYTKDMKKLVSCPAKNSHINGRYEIPSSVEEIYPEAFVNCDNITDLVINQTVKKIGKYAFVSCTFESITIYQTTSYSFLGRHTHFKKVIIPAGYSTFDANIFVSDNYEVRGNCTIGNLWVYDITPPIIDKWSAWNNDIMKNSILYVPKGSKDLYSLSYCWGDFKNIKEFEHE